ncbi:hypothetical protein ACQEVM_37330 [Streptomyces sp. CA-243310]
MPFAGVEPGQYRQRALRAEKNGMVEETKVGSLSKDQMTEFIDANI